MTIDAKIKRMTAEVVAIAVEHGGLVGKDFADRFELEVTSRGKRSFGGIARFLNGKRMGRRDNRGELVPFISINRKKRWWYEPNAYDINSLKARKAYGWNNKLGRRLVKWAEWLEEGKAVMGEYAHIANDPEIGDLTGDPEDTDKILASVITHEVAHAINHENWRRPINLMTSEGSVIIDGKDYGFAAGAAHGDRWAAIYRVLRNAYVNNGAYKTKTAEVIPLPITPRPVEVPADIRLAGLPLFDIAA